MHPMLEHIEQRLPPEQRGPYERGKARGYLVATHHRSRNAAAFRWWCYERRQPFVRATLGTGRLATIEVTLYSAPAPLDTQAQAELRARFAREAARAGCRLSPERAGVQGSRAWSRLVLAPYAESVAAAALEIVLQSIARAAWPGERVHAA